MELFGEGQGGAIARGADVDAQAGYNVAVRAAVLSGSADDGELRDLRKRRSRSAHAGHFAPHGSCFKGIHGCRFSWLRSSSIRKVHLQENPHCRFLEEWHTGLLLRAAPFGAPDSPRYPSNKDVAFAGHSLSILSSISNYSEASNLLQGCAEPHVLQRECQLA